MRCSAFLAALALALFSFAALSDTGRGTEAEAEALVKKAVAFYKKNGLDKTTAELMKKPGPFIDRDLYVSILSPKGELLAHINPRSVGKTVMELRDIDGKYFVKERLEAARKATSGWQEYRTYNPVAKEIEHKNSYWEKHDDLVFSCGAFKKS